MNFRHSPEPLKLTDSESLSQKKNKYIVHDKEVSQCSSEGEA